MHEWNYNLAFPIDNLMSIPTICGQSITILIYYEPRIHIRFVYYKKFMIEYFFILVTVLHSMLRHAQLKYEYTQ